MVSIVYTWFIIRNQLHACMTDERTSSTINAKTTPVNYNMHVFVSRYNGSRDRPRGSDLEGIWVCIACSSMAEREPLRYGGHRVRFLIS